MSFPLYPQNGQGFPHCSFPSYFRTDIPCSQHKGFFALAPLFFTACFLTFLPQHSIYYERAWEGISVVIVEAGGEGGGGGDPWRRLPLLCISLVPVVSLT